MTGIKTIVAALGAVLLAGAMLVHPAGVAASQGLSATGAGHFQSGGGLRTFSFSAITQADGTVTGQAQLNNRGQDASYHIAVDCIQQTGSNTVTVGGAITDSSTGLYIGSHGQFSATDGGPGGKDDTLSLFYIGLDGCNNNLGGNPLDGGNITIHN